MLSSEPTRGSQSASDSERNLYTGDSNQLPLEIIEELLLAHVRSLKAQLPPASSANSRAIAQALTLILTTWRSTDIPRVFRAMLNSIHQVTLDTAARLGDLHLFNTLVAMATNRQNDRCVFKYSDDWLVLAAKGGNLAMLDEWWRLECSPARDKWFWLSTYRARAIIDEGGAQSLVIQVYNAEQHAQIVLTACERGDLALLEWLVDHGAQIHVTQGMLEAASANCHVHLLAYLVQFIAADGAYSFSGPALDAACANGHLGVLAWWSESGLPVHRTESAFLATIQSTTNGIISALDAKQVFDWLDRDGLFTPARTPSSTVARIVMPHADSHPNIVEWLLARNLVVVTPDLLAHTLLASPHKISMPLFETWFRTLCASYPPSDDAMSPIFTAASATGNNMVLSFLSGNVTDARFDEEAVFVAAARGGHTGTLTCCLTTLKLSPGLDVLTRVMEAALVHGHTNVLNWCRIAFPRTPPNWIPVSVAAVTAAAGAGHLAVIKWWVAELRGSRLEKAARVLEKRFTSASVLSAGLEHGHVEVVEWYIQFKGSDRHLPTKRIKAAIVNGHLDTVKRYFELVSTSKDRLDMDRDTGSAWRKPFVAAASRTGRVDLLRWMKETLALADSDGLISGSLCRAGIKSALTACQADSVAFWVDLFGQIWESPLPMPNLFRNPTTRLTVLGLCVQHAAVLNRVVCDAADPVPVAIAAGEVGFLDLYRRVVWPRQNDAKIPRLASAAGQVGVLEWWLHCCYAEVACDPKLAGFKQDLEWAAAKAYRVAVSGGIRLFHVACWWVERSGVSCGVDSARHADIWAPLLAAGLAVAQPQAGAVSLPPPVDVWEDTWEASEDEEEQ